jgi:hypothetical protein
MGSLPGNITVPAGTLIGYQIDLPAGSQAKRFFARRSGSTSPGIRMALYADSGNLPGARLAHSDRVSFSGTEVSASATPDSQDCVSGKAWLVAIADGDLTLGQGANTVPSVQIMASGAEPPASWQGGGGKSGSTLSLYVEVAHP